ncbi:HTH domain-containing protein, partial [uncultured Meiothermus sp.]|uniref:HTH domain-containing protein n=1 Tax=uncultured Meiothermus sp. TaxID=157471 RepID=UPI0026349A4B
IQLILRTVGHALSADEVGDRVGVSRVTAWRYLEYLQQTGFVAVEMEYGSVGRPIKRYKSTAHP